MSVAAPLVLLLLAPAAVVAWWIRRQRPEAVSGWPAMTRVAIAGNRLRKVVASMAHPGYLTLAAVVAAVLTLSRPLWGDGGEGAFTPSREVMVAMDLSRSMLAVDVDPSRMEQARTLTSSLLDALQGERVGLIVFAGTAFVQVPLSPDYQIIREFLPELSPDYMPQGGSDYTGMLQAALDGFGSDADSDRYLIVLSDGESTTEGWQDRLEPLAKRGVHVLSVGIGTEAGGFLDDGWGGYYKDTKGEVIHSSLMPATLQALARRTDGEYLHAEDVDATVAELMKAVRAGRGGHRDSSVSAGASERFQWLLLPAVCLCFAGLVAEFASRPRPRAIRRRKTVVHNASRSAASLAATLWLVLMIVPAPRAEAHFDNLADFDVRQEFDSNPAERLRKIVRHLATYGYDAYDLSLMVEATIKYGIDQQRVGLAPAPGVIEDAIQATRAGEKLDTSIADWAYYRSQLQAMQAAPATADDGGKDQRKPSALDEEDSPPMVAGQSTASGANDSFGQGSSGKTDATLGDLTPPADAKADRQHQKPPAPRSARMAALRASQGGSAGRSDPVLSFSRKRMDEATKRDSPGRLFQMMSDTGQEQQAQEQDW